MQKGLFNVTINDKKVTTPWNVTGYELLSIKAKDFKINDTKAEIGYLSKGPQFLVGEFNIVEGQRLDSFLNTDGWGKGVAYVNGHNLGRYWPIVGPQMTLYVPAEFLIDGKNSLVLLEYEKIPTNRKINFQITPILDYPKSMS